MPRAARVCLLGMLCALPAVAGAQESRCEVRYLSADHVYLDAGTAAGLAMAQEVRVMRDGTEIAVLEVVYAAEHSASCRVVSSVGEIKLGDTVLFQPAPAATPPAIAPPAAVAEPAPGRRRAPSGRRETTPVTGARVEGAIGMAWDHAGGGDIDLRSDFVSVPFRLRARDLAGGLELRARGSLRRIMRDGYGLTPRAEWRNRILEVALVQDDPARDWNIAAGRINSRVAAVAGPFDGVRFDRRVAAGWRVGGFAGLAPSWQDLGFGTDDRVAGVTVAAVRQVGAGGLLDVLLAATGRYHRGEVSREVVSMATTLRLGDVNVVQSAELDVNRRWRRDAVGRGADLSSLALTARWQATRDLALSLGYDDREPVRTWETRALPDSLFTDAGRRGLSAGANLRGHGGRNLDVRGSVRHDERTRDDVASGSVRVFLPALPTTNLDLDLALRAFDGPYLSGWSPTIGLTCRANRDLDLRVDAGHQVTTSASRFGHENRSYGWVRLGGRQQILNDWTVGLEYERDGGDDVTGDRWLVEWRRRF